MCGIAGYIANRDSEKLRTAISILALKMEDRGSHSWGMMYGAPSIVPAVHRVASSVSVSFDLPETMPSAMALHTRHATTGKIKPTNAHPFTWKGAAGQVTGMHNGIISNHAQLGRAFKRQYRVDSEHIFAHIADGLDLSDLQGYGTIVYSQNGEWFIGRFNGGELSIVSTDLGVFFASTESALRLAMRAAGITINKWHNTVDGRLYAISAKGISKRGDVLTVAHDLWCGKWDDDVTLLDAGMDVDYEPEDEDAIAFDSTGEECDGCGTPTALGSVIWWTEHRTLCDRCFKSQSKKKGGKK